MSTFIQILNILNDNLLSIGLIIFSPAIYQLVYKITYFLAEKFIKTKKDVVIEYYQDKELKRVITLNPDTTKIPEPDKQ